MAICKRCSQDMLTSNACTDFVYIHEDLTVIPTKFGHEQWSKIDITEIRNRCRDCNVEIGKFHHAGCDYERCGICGEQKIACDCKAHVLIK